MNEIQEETEVNRINTIERHDNFFEYIKIIKKHIMEKDSKNVTLKQQIRTLDKEHGIIEESCEKRDSEFAESFGRGS